MSSNLNTKQNPMIKNTILGYLAFFLIFIVLPTACTSDKLPEPEPPAFCDTIKVSYNLQIKDIIDTNCAIAGCHRAGTRAPGDYTSYNSIEPFLVDREFKRYVIDLRNDPDIGMPPNWETNPGPKDLTPEEFDIVSCWVEAGYPEE